MPDSAAASAAEAPTRVAASTAEAEISTEAADSVVVGSTAEAEVDLAEAVTARRFDPAAIDGTATNQAARRAAWTAS
jgi:hypothetical protein